MTRQGKRVYGGVSRDQRVAERKERFIEAGIQVFGTAGYHAATVRSLCAAAGLTDRYFYESFSDTESLLCAVYEHLMSELWKRLLLRLKDHQPDSRGNLARACMSLFFETVRDRRVGRIFLFEVLGASRQLNKLYRHNAREFAAWLMGIVTSIEPTLRMNEADEELIGLALIGAISQTALQWMLDEYRIPQDRVVESCTTVMLGTVRQLMDEASQRPKRRAATRAGVARGV
jgi:AcrR family transcriptional regulator